MAAATGNKWRLDGQTVLVTGGTRGLGKAIIEELCLLGASAYTCARSEDDLQRCLGEWRAKGFRVEGCCCDVKDASSREDLIRRVSSAFGGKLNHLINNVGTNIRKPTAEYSLDDFRHVMTTNFESAYHLCQLAHPLLKKAASGEALSPSNLSASPPPSPPLLPSTRGNASIVFNSSVAGLVAIRSGSIYAATKGAMNQLTKNLACEWAKDGIRVNTVAPWYTNTDLAQQVLRDEEFKREVVGRTPLRRVGEPEEVASAVAFFCLGASSFISGQILAVDGAFSVNGFYPPTD